MSGAQRDFPLTISLNVLEHLGINLYSNVPAVLSETVANAWDADASEVRVNWNKDAGTIVIQDDGIGMTPDDIVDRFLNVGYRRRDKQPGMTKKDRRPMGRKGIGKLSLFSVADVVDVETIKGGTASAFRLDAAKIRKEIQRAGSGTYHAEHLPVDNTDFLVGTRLTLRKLRRRQSIRTSAGLKKRVARRFSIIGAKQGFRVFVDDDEIMPADRDYYDKIRYMWTYGDQEDVRAQCKNIENHECRTRNIAHDELKVTGWLATVRKVRDLEDQDGADDRPGDNLNRIAIFVRGKLAQEDMLTDFPERGVYASYLIGELRVDDLDQYDGPKTRQDEDAATSSRQRIVEDDPRYRQLHQLVEKELKHIQARWRELRSREGLEKAVNIPEVKRWLEKLPPQPKRKARHWLGRLNQIRIEDVDEQKNLIKHAVLAFEFYRANEDLRRLELVSDGDLEATLAVFRNLDVVENSLYGQIARQRLEIIDTMRRKVDKNALERVVQEYLFDHLWLLDPSWERVEGTEFMERRVSKLFEDVDAKLTKEERFARLDIRYRKTAGQHVIIELKRPERIVVTAQLVNQLEKYKAAMSKLLAAQERVHEPVEFVVLLGKEPPEWSNVGGKGRSIDLLRRIYNARIVFYDKLLNDAYEAYADYTKQRQHTTYLEGVIGAIEDYAPSES